MTCPQVFAIQLQPEDIVIAGTDGLFDNVFPEESAALMRHVLCCALAGI